jgi:uncharacterized lipoprotein YddW (UPF0748 family)
MYFKIFKLSGIQIMKNKIILYLFLLVCISSIAIPKPIQKPVRGVWLTNVDSKVLNSKANIIEAVNLCDKLGINTIFVVTLNKAMTTYPSKIMENMTGVKIDTMYTGRDPLKELITEAHRKNIKVIAWFEYGFSASYKSNGGEILKRKPEWASKDVEGKLATKSGFEWMNGFLPEVQDFMLSLIMEVVKNYDVDGIQGDDRLPAMPSESGYDSYTVERYKKEHNGLTPPANSKDSAWVQWRTDIMTDFLQRIYTEVKGYNKNLIVSMSPSIYPWGKEEYLQDWPLWVKKGLVDLVVPQIYRYDIKGYVKAIDDIVKGQIDKKDFNKFIPGLLINTGDYSAKDAYLEKMLKANRKRGIKGESYFFYEGIKKYPKLLKKFYK